MLKERLYNLKLQMMAYRSAEHDTTKYSPNMMMFGRDVRQPVDLLYGTVSNTENFDNLSDYVINLKKIHIQWLHFI
jgi:hypothetical protein